MAIEVSRGQQFLAHQSELPEESYGLIIKSNTLNNEFLDAIAKVSLSPLTLRLFCAFEHIWADTCSRWLLHGDKLLVIAAFARILPLAPHLSIYLEDFLKSDTPPSDSSIPFLSEQSNELQEDLTSECWQRLLLATFRLLKHDKHTFSSAISVPKIQNLLSHDDRAVRYLAVRILCIHLSASDLKLGQLIDTYVGSEGVVSGDYDGRLIDYAFLSLHEKARRRETEKFRAEISSYPIGTHAISTNFLSPATIAHGSVVLPRPLGQPRKKSSLIQTATTADNLQSLAKALLSPSPILVHGLPGAGKTSLVNDLARELGKDSTMVTLHLNEQTDAKMLIGMYTTGAQPGSFTWRAGVLTTAVREGRWVFIEDLDRAPTEVISVILSLIEKGELLIPSRGETVRASRGFRILASIRTNLNMNGEETPPALHMLGSRLWMRVPVRMAAQSEIEVIIKGIHPILESFLPEIIAVYQRLYNVAQKFPFNSKSKTTLGRPISPRDLLKWCRRLELILMEAKTTSGIAFTEATQNDMFMEAADCFASSLQTAETRKLVVSAIAEEMRIPPQRVDHYLDAHLPRYEDTGSSLQIGRVKLLKKPVINRVAKSIKRSRPFANTKHAKRLLEQLGVALRMAEPVLLVGETGIGKTTVIQQLADSLGFRLTAVNLSQQSEVGDLLGGFKPVNIRSLAIPLKEEFDELFQATGISANRNQKYLDSLGRCVAKAQWSRALKLWREAPKMFERIILDLVKMDEAKAEKPSEQPSKRRKTESKLQSLLALRSRWTRFSKSLEEFEVQISGGEKGFAFTFVEGNIIKAVRNGEWVLLDEINLASPDTLEAIADLLHSGLGGSPSILLSETGEIERIQAHPDFRIFGAMNPATDVGKRDLPMGLRSRFTEIYVESPDRNLDDLLAVIEAYLRTSSSTDKKAAHDVARLYLNTKRLADEKRLVDGASQIPHFSLRTLTRVLSYVTDIAPSYGLRRALYEGFAMGFLTLLDRESERMLMPLINHHLLESHGNPQALLAQSPKHPEDGKQYVKFMNKKRDRQYWMLQGHEPPQDQPHYIITPFVERNMLNLVRATSTRRFPVLVQGPTSAGKTSMIEYLAKYSGNKFVRINNHEHTDLQEYLGTYISGSDGQLRFQEGLLVQALRQGHWIVLDELNLAPTDVLEALNRLLDDNRELLIPETQEIVRPHENFMLFATQNPPGLYGGRKTLSRAFRNRFLELHFDDIPEDELEFILQHRSQKTAPSDCKRIVTVYKELSRLRQSSRLFEQKDSFATLRDLFRWALRDADNREQLAANGYMLLAERVRKTEERAAVKEIIEKVMKVKIDPVALYSESLSPEIKLYESTLNSQGVVWTQAMRRLYVLVAHALRNNEPVLLVGETGCGKTTVCQMLAEAFGKELHVVNAHQNTETGDLVGAHRPVRNRTQILKELEEEISLALNPYKDQGDGLLQDLDALVASYNALSVDELLKVPSDVQERIALLQGKTKALFEWSDGSLVQAMKEAQFFLLDEISLADDSVLERLNSVLESQRTILLAEKGITDSFVQACDGFQFFATMNPGGDYGKRELSPALRNRFTEIWVPSLTEHDDVFQIVETKLKASLKSFAEAMVEFAEWFGQTYRSSSSQSISVRDVLAWVGFMNHCALPDDYSALLHGAAMVYIDTLGANPAALLAIDPQSIHGERQKCLQQLGILTKHDMLSLYPTQIQIASDPKTLFFGDFGISKNPDSHTDSDFAFDAPTTKSNAMRMVRALQLNKPILLEGSPGVGKTTLIAALAKGVGKPLTRINLSEQTDLMDLFGSDVPVEGAEAGNFAWRDAPFLQAMQRGDWVLLDEMNLASQSVLEGLNACLDHRGEVYISELDQTFRRHPNFSVFAAQNPHHQGGGRKGLPSSFVNRFTVVYADVFRNDDLMLICKHNFPTMNETIVSKVISFVSTLEQEVVHKRRFGSQGGPWEFNLRDTLRWLHLLDSREPMLAAGSPADFVALIFRQRFRSLRDRQEVDRIFTQVFGHPADFRHLFHDLAVDAYQVGMASMPRHSLQQKLSFPGPRMVNRLAELESVMMCIQQNAPCILVGSSGSGKSTILEHVGAAAGVDLVVFPLNADIDTMDLVGGFEQVDPQRVSAAFLSSLVDFLEARVLSSLPSAVPSEALQLLSLAKRSELISSDHFSRLLNLLCKLQEKTSVPGLNPLIESCRLLGTAPTTIENARFEWVDGILVKALERGSWLVLDNANLCSSSVLDRLNSLLEPNGVLIINEHSGPNGEPKLVKPHPDFRLFMTMDPRYGELSRAMRNRSVEIYIEPLPSSASTIELNCVVESQMQRFGQVIEGLETGNSASAAVAIDGLSVGDFALIDRFSQSLCAFPGELPNVPDVLRAMKARQDALGSGLGEQIAQMYNTLGSSSEFPRSFRDAQVSDRAVPISRIFTDRSIKTIHPLQNSPLVPLLQLSSDTDESYWFATILELKSSMHHGREAASDQLAKLETLKPSQMNRLQRSMVANRIPAATKDSTFRTATFLHETLQHLGIYLQSSSTTSMSWREHRRVLQGVLQIWWDTYSLATEGVFEEALFQAHLAITTEELSKLDANTSTVVIKSGQNGARSLIQWVSTNLSRSFESGFKLSSGLQMESLWGLFRPPPISSLFMLQTLLELEKFAARFDSFRWKVSVSVPELVNVVSALVKTFSLISTSNQVDASSLVAELNSALTSLESKLFADDTGVLPFFAEQFESLRQYKSVHDLRTNEACPPVQELEVLSNCSTTSLMRHQARSSQPNGLSFVEYIFTDGSLKPVEDSFTIETLHKLQRIGDVNLLSLRLLETELPALGAQIADMSSNLCENQINIATGVNSLLCHLMEKVIIAIDDNLADWFLSAMQKVTSGIELENTVPPASGDSAFSETSHTYDTYFQESMRRVSYAENAGSEALMHSAAAWVSFAVACIHLYVPDRSFDPDKRQRLLRTRHLQMLEALQDKLEALKSFEVIFTGQESNTRCHIIEEDLKELGPPGPALQEIYRPEISELEQLQGEFNNLLNVVAKANPIALIQGFQQSKTKEDQQAIKLLLSNVGQIIQRLTERHRGYRDMTVPAVGILQCLRIGLSMALMQCQEDGTAHSSIRTLSAITPFLGSRPDSMPDTTDHPLELLARLSASAAVEGLGALETGTLTSFFNIIHNCYENWTKKLDADRQEAESKTGLYRFRGSAEDEEEIDQEQFNELFPDYENKTSESENTQPAHSTRDVAVSVADVHSQIVLGGQNATTIIESLLQLMSHRIGNLSVGHISFTGDQMVRDLLPGVMITLSNQLDALRSTDSEAESYNFYVDANLPESRKLVTLIHQIQTRFRELQEVDEIAHMQPLEDVMVACRELLEFRHTEPIAKIITKVEKVHLYMHEWQFGGWASRANSAVALYDNLTQTIVSWRRLELSTWAKLFDMENKKCDEDAKAWWFVAYQVVVAAPLGMADNKVELKTYAQKLLQDLETYFSSAIQGQFSQRLKLLKQLQVHLGLLSKDLPHLAIISIAVKNFLDIYIPYEKLVMENIKKGRATLERTMKDVLLLASWKDTNIVALRDSAKRSHHKLFKLVRKYRTLLGQPMDLLINQGLPDTPDLSLETSNLIMGKFPVVDQAALEHCAAHVPVWKSKSKRFINISQTVGMMDEAVQLPMNSVDGTSYLESFLADIITSTAELQKATPSVLTEENKDTVKHLKSRKRKLFADTIKELRQMGIKHNLGTAALSYQESLSLVLSSTGSISTLGRQEVEYYYLKTLDILPRARAATREHSDDLSNAEVIRSIGLLEGLLQLIVKQRNVLSASIDSASQVGSIIAQISSLWAPNNYVISAKSICTSRGKMLSWLPNILQLAIRLVKVHSKLGSTQIVDVLASLNLWVEKFELLLSQYHELPELPKGITTSKHDELANEIDEAVQQLNTNLTSLCEDTSHPGLEYILGQISPWTAVRATSLEKHEVDTDIATLDKTLSTVSDSILSSIELFKKSTSIHPTSTDGNAWLAEVEKCLANGITSLHSPKIASLILGSLNMLLKVDLEDLATAKSAAAIFTVALPIFQQYFNTLQSAISRYADLHTSTCKMSYILGKTFIQLATKGFCTPSEKPQDQDGQTEKLEGGTGLGEGEGAEDISKDIQDDENLDDLAQEPNKEDQGEIEDQQDAVDMADGDMEGEMGEAEEKEDNENGSGEESGDDEMDEEAGDVDDLDPNAVDEKMWDGNDEKAEKDQEGDESKGKTEKDEQVAAQEDETKGTEGDEGDEGDDEDEEAAGAEQSEDVAQQDEIEKHDPHAQEEDKLDLPDDMELDGDGNEVDESINSDDEMDDLSDVNKDDEEEDEVDKGDGEYTNAEDAEDQENQDIGEEMDVIDLDDEKEPEDSGEETKDAGEQTEEQPEPQFDDEDGKLNDNADDSKADADNTAQSEAQGTGDDQDNTQSKQDANQSNKAQRDDGAEGGDSNEHRDTAADEGDKGRQSKGAAGQDEDQETQTSADAQPFKKLGDALEKWHRQQTKIQDAPQEPENTQEQPMDVNGDNSEFQHLQDEEAEADAQALGTATEEQSRALDESMAIDTETNEMPDTFQPDEVDVDDKEDDAAMEVENVNKEQQDTANDYEGRAGAMVQQSNPGRDQDLVDKRMQEFNGLEDDVEDMDNQLETTHINDPTLMSMSRSAEDARALWSRYESLTRDLSLSLTEQLRLILAPTQATKMRGDFRTGKRLNIKRIIPYIASQYKRDKIWMRRSVPSKRSYQIMLAVDDSKSMGESGSGSLAFETLVMVSKSLNMLEIGEICVVGFGQDVRVAHDFDTPFSADAGPKVFQNFGFEQSRTNVTKLIHDSIDLFRTARAKASSTPADLWQLQLIISDGVCDSSEHEPIRRLLREAIEERIMMVFVIVDDVRNKKKGESVMDLKEAKFVKNEMGNSEVKIERYLDTFPFQYYLIVSDVRELPGVLATLLRQWFAEVADSS